MTYETMTMSELIDKFLAFSRKVDSKMFDIEFCDDAGGASLRAINYYKKELEKINESLFNRFGVRI